MEFWRDCWNCDHETIHERVDLQFFPRVVEMFSKHPNGKVNQRVWAVFFGAYSFTKCKKCSAPSLFVDEYWPQTEDNDEAKLIAKEVRETGKSKLGNCINSLTYPGFSKEPFPQWTHDLDEVTMLLFWEVYQAISLGLRSLAIMGLRTIIDKYANDTIGDIGGFAKKLKRLKDDNFINSAQYELLEIVIDVGSAAAHRGHRPDKQHLIACL
jgi:hypothetical protein